MLAQFPGFDAASVSADFDCNIPVTDLSAITQRRIRKRKANAIIGKTKVFRSFGYAVRREPFRQTGIVPVGIKHEWRTHHHSAAPIEPLLLFARGGQAAGI